MQRFPESVQRRLTEEGSERRLGTSRGDADDALFSALRTEDLDDVAMMFDGGAVRGNGVGSVVEENDGVGLGGVFGELLLGGGADPVGNAVRLGREGRCYGEAGENDQG